MRTKAGNGGEDVNTMHLLPQTLAVLQLINSGVTESEVAAMFKDQERAEALIQFLKKSDFVVKSGNGLSVSDMGRYLLRAYSTT